MSAVREVFENDQRLQMRFKVLQAARLKTAEGQELACEIRDFCLGGMFLKFHGQQDEAGVLHQLQENARVEVSFTAPPSISKATFNVKARIARRSQDGVGVAFIGTPIDATRTLNKIAASMRTQRLVSKRYQGMDAGALQESSQNLLSQALQDAVNEFYGLIEEKLSATSAQSSNFAERNEIMGAFDQIRLHELKVHQGVQQHVMDKLEQAFKRKGKPEPAKIDKPGLSIVQTDEFEDWLNLTAEINKLESRFSEELLALQPRLEKLYGRAVDRSTNPYAPAVIEQAVKAAFEGLSLSLKVRQVVYGAMREALMNPLAELYKQLETILPEADNQAPQAGVQTKDAWAEMAGTQMQEDINPEAAMFAGSQSAASELAGPGAGNEAGSPAPTVGGVAGALMNLFRRAQQPRQPFASAAVQNGTSAAAGEAQGVVAATHGGTPQAGHFGQRFAASSRRVLGDLLASGRIQPGQQEVAEGSAEVFGVLAETIESENTLPSAVKHYVKQLEEPLLKLAVLDSGFLNSPQHPAHRVLNAVDRLAMVTSDDGKIEDRKMLQIIQRWTERIKNEADKNPGIYEEARCQLEKVLLPLMRMRSIHIARLQAGLEGWQKTGQANRAITQEIERRIAGREVADAILEFFNPGWRNYLIRVMLRHGAGSAEEAEAWQAVDKLLQWMDPNVSERPPFREAQRLLSYIDARLSLVSAGKDVQESILDRLADGLFHPEKCNYKQLSGANVAVRQQEEKQTLSEEDAVLLGQFRVGDWLNFANAVTPLNLIWIGDDPHVYVFSNYKGKRKLELKRQEFLQLLKSGEARVTDNLDLPLMDRSFSSMIEHMHRNLLKQAINDPETGLMRRTEFMRRVKRAWLHVDGENSGCVLGVIDIEDLRMVQMRISEEGYRKLILALAGHLDQKIDSGGFIARTGERAFAFMRPCQGQEEALEMAEGLITRINQFGFEWEGEMFTLTANAGLAWAGAFVEPEELYNKADSACLSAKHEGHNQLVLYREEDEEHKGHAGLVYWAGRFNSILSGGRLFLRCQPIVPLAEESDQPAHYEILLGATSDESEPIQIGDFVAAIERLKRITELDQWVVREAFEWIRNHPREFERVGAFSINLSGQSVNSKSFFSFMEEELGRGDIPGQKLIFEITESAAIDSFVNAEQFIKKLRRYGCRFSLDDFGVGFSSFTYLKNLKVDYLKIDGSFIRDMQRNDVDVALVSSMHETSRFLGIKTIAESVENQETLEQLKKIGINYVQGYHTGKPVPIERIAA
jgi:EAL domain-containing protein (putative c-di-GMP-specific phosphodiesterase class I)/GGDEF domain-containing protein